MLALLILSLHLAIIAFKIFGLIIIPIGAARGWRFVRAPVWRLLYLALLGVVAIQAIFGESCILTIWQDLAERRSGTSIPLITRYVNAVIFWPLPMWMFTVIYICVAVYAVALFWLVPPRSNRSQRKR